MDKLVEDDNSVYSVYYAQIYLEARPMKTSQYPVWKRFVSIMLVILMLVPSMGMTAAAEELLEEEHEHHYDYAFTQEPDCTEHGFSVYTCACGDSLTEDVQEPLGHDWAQAEAEADGQILYICTRCGAEKTETLEAASESAETVLLTEEPAAEDTALTEEWIEEDALPSAEEPQNPADALETEMIEPEAESQTQEREIDPDTVSILAADGIFPEGAVLSVTKAEAPVLQTGEVLSLNGSGEPEENDEIIYDEAIPDGDGFLLVNARSADAEYSVTREVVASYSYEIHMTGVDGEALQPPEGQSVTLAFELPEAKDERLDVRVLHYPADGAAEELPVRVENGTVYAETTGFSAFVVEFRYEYYRYSITSGHVTNIQTIAEDVLRGFVDEHYGVVGAVSSNPEALYVSHVNGIWELEALRLTDKPVELVVTLGDEDGHAIGDFPIQVDMREPSKIKYKAYNDKMEAETRVLDGYIPVSSLRDVMGVTLKDGWYVVDQDVSFQEHRLTVLGDVHLILRDGCTLVSRYGIRTACNVDPNTSLTIYGEDRGTGVLRCEVDYGMETTESFYAGIGGNNKEDGGRITIHGCTIKAEGAINAAAVGGGDEGNLRGFTMYAGELSVMGRSGCGIGGGPNGTNTGPIAVNGGIINANSRGYDKNSGDNINSCAAIGAGRYKNLGADIIINGGLVVAASVNGGAGIGDFAITRNGKHNDVNGGSVIINGGHIIASSDSGAGIGGTVYGGIACTVTINDGFVEAVSYGQGAGIGGGANGSGGIVNINGGYVIARGTELDIPFKRRHKWITTEKQSSLARAGLEVIANLIIGATAQHHFGGAGIGGGDSGNGGTVTIKGGTVFASSGAPGSFGIGNGLGGKSKGSLTIQYPDGRIRYGSTENALTDELKRRDDDRVKAAQADRIAYIFSCSHEEKVYDVIDDRYHVHACKYCKYQERPSGHTFNENGVCTACYYKKNGVAEQYPIWYFGTQLNTDTREGDGYRYDPATKTLTLTKYVNANDRTQLKNSAGIYAEGDLCIAGPGDGTAVGAKVKSFGDYGVYVKGGTLTLKESSALEFTGNRYGIYAPDGLKIEKVSHLNAAGSTSDGAVFWGSKSLQVQEDLTFKSPVYNIPGTSGIIEMLKKDTQSGGQVEIVPGVSLSFDANGALGTMQPMKGLISGREYTLPKLAFTWPNHEFIGWEFNNRGYPAESKFTLNSDLTAKAQWKDHFHDYKLKSWEWEGLTRAKATFVCSTCGDASEVYAGIAKEVTKPATCTEPGIRTYTAIIYRDLRYENKKEVSIPALGHDWGPGIVTKEATTEAPGVRTYTCRNDSSHVWTEPIPQLHKHDLQKVESVKPTCVEPGNIEYWICKGCATCFSDAEGKNEIYADSVKLPATGEHVPSGSWSREVVKQPTCTEMGIMAYRFYCRICDQLMEPRNNSIDPLGHKWSDWVTTKEATDSEEGAQTRTCERCNETQTRSIARLEKHTLTKVERKEPDCTTPGSIAYYKCTGCGAMFSDASGLIQLQEKDIVIPAKGHQYGAPINWTIKEPTCTEAGRMHTELHCSVCDELFAAGELPLEALGHSWGNWTVTKEATETEEGIETSVCIRDSSHVETRPIPKKAHVHVLTRTEARAASCTAAGNTAYWTCSGCGKLFSDAEGRNEIRQQSIAIPAKGHSPGGWTETVVKSSTCTDQGVKHFEQRCTVCGVRLNARDEVIPALGHNWSAWVTTKPATETATGIQTRTCANDRAHIQTRIITRLEHRHSMTKIAAVEATCTEPGSIACYRCTGCGKTYSDAAGKNEITQSDITIPAKGHAAEEFWTSVETVKKSTCTETGIEKLELLCKNCETVLETREEVIPALGHTWGEWVVTRPATETEEGAESRTCYHDSTHTETRVIPKLEHKHHPVAVAEKAATCTEAGNIAYWRCSGCGLLFRDAAGTKQIEAEETVITPMGHSAKEIWEEGEITRAATCTEPGSRKLTLHCQICKEVLSTRDGVVPALGHDWDAWTVTEAATEEAEGVETRSCVRDGSHTETRAIPKLAHTHRLKAEAAVEPTCTEEGVRAYWICEGCGRLFSDAQGSAETGWNALTIPPLGHSAQSWWESETAAYPTCTTEGYDRLALYCSRCNEILSTRGRRTDALGHDWGEWVSTTAATEEEEGTETRTCLNDPTHTQTRTVPRLPHTHKLTEVAARAETCTEAGCIACWRCSGCGKLFSDAEGRNEIQQQNTVIPASGHSPGEWTETVVKTPSCSEQGEKHLEQLCIFCNTPLSARDELIPALGHSWSAWVTVKAATEEETGIQTRTCLNDPAHTETRTIPKLEHRHHMTKIDFAAASCNGAGNIAFYLCTGCGRSYADAAGTRELTNSELVIPAKGHSAEDTWVPVETTKQATCTEAGVEALALYCRDCGEILSTRDRRIPALGHNWSEWSTTRPATEEETGIQTRTCINDPAHTETRTIPKLEHRHNMTMINAVAATCTGSGNIAFYLCTGCSRTYADAAGTRELTNSELVIPAKGHSAEETWTYVETVSQATCTRTGLEELALYCQDCGEILSTRTRLIPALGHSWGEWVTARPASEAEEGIETRSCLNDASHVETRAIPKLQHRHELNAVAEKAATCTEAGNTAHWKCSGCGLLFADKAGTQQIEEEDTVTAPLGHSAKESWDEGEITRAATCTEPGSRKLTLRCRICNEILSTRDGMIPALCHSWGEWVTTRPASETEEGIETRSCLYDASHVETRAIPKLQHTHKLTEVREEPATCTEAGNIAYWSCSGCGLLFSDAAGTKQIEEEDTVIAPLGHSARESWDEGEITKAATCTEPGSRKPTLHCQICNEILSTRDGVIPALGHSWGTWTVTVEATEEAEGVETRVCAHNSSHIETRAIPRLVHTHRLKAEEAIAATCTEEGRRAFWSCEACGRLFSDEQGTVETERDDLRIPPLGHNAEAEWTGEITSEPGCIVPGYKRLALHCSRCGEILSTRGEKIPALGHNWGEWVSTTAATEEEEGTETCTCLNDPTHTQTRTVPKLPHTHKLTVVAARAETCTEAGSIAYWRCSGCGRLFSDEEGQTPIEEENIEIQPSGHTAGEAWTEAEIARQPGCETAGIRHLELRCSKCGETLSTRSESIPAHGHDWDEATYQWSDDLDTVIAERICKNDESHIEQEISKDIEILRLVPPSCEESGEDLYTASFKNEAFEARKSMKTEALGHRWGEWSVTKEATENTDGEMSRTCLNDPSHKQTAVIPKTGHVHGLTRCEAKEPTCTEGGNKEYWVCEKGENPCGGVFTDAEGTNEVVGEDYDSLLLAPLGHKWKVESAEWTDDLYSAVFTFACERDGSHTREVLGEVPEEPILTPPSAQEDGKLTYTATAILDGTAYQATKDVVIERAKPVFKTHSLVLSGEIGVHFFMKLPEIEGVDYSESYMSFRVKDLEKRVNFDPEKMNAGKTYYRFTCFVPSIMMAQPITATFHYGEDQTVEQTYTIMQYIQEFEKRSDEFPAATQQVVKALANFGHYIQPFLSDVRGWKIGTDYAEMTEHFKESYSEEELAAVGEAVADQAIVRDPGSSRIQKVTYNLVLDSETAIRVYLKPKRGYSGEVMATLDGGTENVAEAESDGRYLITIPNISAHQLGDMHTISVTAGGSFTIEVSALSYIQSILTSDTYKADQNARNAMAALYEYYHAVAEAKQ